MEMTILLLGYKGYEFEKDGETLSGAKIHFIASNMNGENISGFLPIEEKVELGFAKTLDYPTGLYKAQISMVSGKGNSGVLKITGLTPIKEIDFNKLMVS